MYSYNLSFNYKLFDKFFLLIYDKNMKKFGYFCAILLCFSCLLSSYLTTKGMVFAEDEFKILAFGDSISAAYAPYVSPYNDTSATEDETLLEKRRMLINYKNLFIELKEVFLRGRF